MNNEGAKVKNGKTVTKPMQTRSTPALGSTIVLHDGSLGSSTEINKEGWIIIDGASIDRLILAARRNCSAKDGLKRIFMIIAGGYEVSPAALGINKESWLTLRKSKLPNMSQIYIRKLKSFKKDVEEAGGKVIVSSLVPRPADVDNTKSHNQLSLQRFLSQKFIEFDYAIHALNGSQQTPNIRGVFEVRSRNNRRGELRLSRMYYEYDDEINRRKQKLIELNRFKNDLIHANDAGRVLALKYIEKFFEKMD